MRETKLTSEGALSSCAGCVDELNPAMKNGLLLKSCLVLITHSQSPLSRVGSVTGLPGAPSSEDDDDFFVATSASEPYGHDVTNTSSNFYFFVGSEGTAMKILTRSKTHTPLLFIYIYFFFNIFAGVTRAEGGVTKTHLRSRGRVHPFFRTAVCPPVPTTHSRNSALDAALYLSSGAYAAC